MCSSEKEPDRVAIIIVGPISDNFPRGNVKFGVHFTQISLWVPANWISKLRRSSSSSWVASKPSKLQSKKNGSSMFKVDCRAIFLKASLPSFPNPCLSRFLLSLRRSKSRGVANFAREVTQAQTDPGWLRRFGGWGESDRCLCSVEFIILSAAAHTHTHTHTHTFTISGGQTSEVHSLVKSSSWNSVKKRSLQYH